jgi:hypothetical protein
VKYFIGVLTVLTASTANAATPSEICQNPLLSYQQRSLCQEQINGAQTIDEQKKIQAKFRDRVKEAEEAQKSKDKK